LEASGKSNNDNSGKQDCHEGRKNNRKYLIYTLTVVKKPFHPMDCLAGGFPHALILQL
jgi:hypothetical protein